MAGDSKIEWTDATWNPVVGCSIVSPGCTNCYAMKDAWRKHHIPAMPHYHGLTKKVNDSAVWTGKIAQAPDHILLQPLHWRKPKRIFVNSMGDLFHESIPDEWIDKVFAVMALAPQHTFQVLTKRADRMREYLRTCAHRVIHVLGGHYYQHHAEARWPLYIEPQKTPGGPPDMICFKHWPLPNVWLGVSAERQQEADERIPHLLNTPAAVRFVSAEPLLGPIDFTQIDDGAAHREVPREEWGTVDDDDSPPALWWNALTGERTIMHGGATGEWSRRDAKLDWVIVGGESGPNARPIHPQWARDIRDQCAEADVAFFFKQWGEWRGLATDEPDTWEAHKARGARDSHTWPDETVSELVGKKAAGRLLDDKEHNAFPNPQPSSLADQPTGRVPGMDDFADGERAAAVRNDR